MIPDITSLLKEKKKRLKIYLWTSIIPEAPFFLLVLPENQAACSGTSYQQWPQLESKRAWPWYQSLFITQRCPRRNQLLQRGGWRQQISLSRVIEISCLVIKGVQKSNRFWFGSYCFSYTLGKEREGLGRGEGERGVFSRVLWCQIFLAMNF